jgi:hypothetical protein
MTSNVTAQSTYHALLIGIDDYATKPLYGCVNDIDAVQRLLLDRRVGIAKGSIKRLASAHKNAKHETTIADTSATLAGLRAALAELGSQKVAEDDHVFIYYSGHGARVPVFGPDNQIYYREALVPVDFDAQPDKYQLLFDFELNRLIAAVTARTPAVTICLDCCHSAGATRAPERSDMVPRFIDLVSSWGEEKLAQRLAISPEIARMLAEGERGVVGSVDACQVVAACLNHETAQEATGIDGVRHGLLTRALVTALNNEPSSDLRSVPWGRIWLKMRADIEAGNPWQHPWMAGNLARLVIAGPPVGDDMGLAIARSGPNAYRIDAGTLASVTAGAMLAVYGTAPPRFPALDSAEDLRARYGKVLLKVTHAERSTAVAEADGPPFDLPPGARARLVRPGAPARIRCALIPKDNALAASLSASPLLELVAEEAKPQVRLEGSADGSWAITDDVHGAKPGYPALFTIQPHMKGRVRELLEHYFYYSLPLRMVTLCTDLEHALQTTLLSCPKGRKLSADEAQAADLPEVKAGKEFPYELTAGDEICIRIRNTSNQRLRVTLLNAAASGKVQLLGDGIIDGGSFYVFWAGNDLGFPFEMTPPEGATQSIDRLVAFGTTAFEKDIGYLRLDTTFAEIADPERRHGTPKDINDHRTSNPPPEQWTVTETIIRTSSKA